MNPTDYEITSRLRTLRLPHLSRLVRLYQNDTRALPLIQRELKRRKQQRINSYQLKAPKR